MYLCTLISRIVDKTCTAVTFILTITMFFFEYHYRVRYLGFSATIIRHDSCLNTSAYLRE